MLYTLKSIARRGTLLGAAAALVVAALIPASSAFADALNPLTERSLTLSSSSPGWADTDGSGNSTYAPPNSGANGKKTGNYFSFKVSTDTTAGSDKIKAMTFQYCTKSAGLCAAPGDDTVHGTDTDSTSDLNINYNTAAHTAGDGGTEAQEIGDTDADGAAGDLADVFDVSGATNPEGVIKAVPGYTNDNPKYQAGGGTGDTAEAAKDVKGTYLVVYKQPTDTDWTQSTGWTVATANAEEASTDTTGQKNTIVLSNSTGLDASGIAAGTEVKVFFFANDTNYITNPGSGAFFVKINTYKAFTPLNGTTSTLATNAPDVIDGGVTVANVMNQSIQITTKVLETMQFSVGTIDPDTLTKTQLDASALDKDTHGTCDTIQTAMTDSGPQNVLELGDQDSESSLSTDHTYATHSYWRLSSNSSAGATVYYSGHTLSNTSGDEIAAIGTTPKTSNPGSEQFGLAIDANALDAAHTFNTGTYGVDYGVDRTSGTPNKFYENAPDSNDTLTLAGVDDSTLTDLGATYDSGSSTWDYTNLNASYHTPRLDPLAPINGYGDGYGMINTDGQDPYGDGTKAQFAFNTMSDTVPEPIAKESDQVVDCVTAKMRYIGNIAATTPAGIYTTKINYIAAPQY